MIGRRRGRPRALRDYFVMLFGYKPTQLLVVGGESTSG
jgi:hypothetical protein